MSPESFGYRCGDDRQSRNVGGAETVFNWGLGWDMLSEESSAGTLQRTYVGRHGHIDGTDPSTGDYAHYLHDHLGSVRAVYDQAKALLATSAYTPYGDRYSAQAADTTPLGYTGHYWEGATNLYYAPYRHYSPAQARWMSRDPLGMVDGPNVYAYVAGNPVNGIDLLGLSRDEGESYLDCINNVFRDAGLSQLTILVIGTVCVVLCAFPPYVGCAVCALGVAGGVGVSLATLHEICDEDEPHFRRDDGMHSPWNPYP